MGNVPLTVTFSWSVAAVVVSWGCNRLSAYAYNILKHYNHLPLMHNNDAP